MKISSKILFSLMSFLLCVVLMFDYVRADGDGIIVYHPPRRMSDIRGGVILQDSKESVLHRIVRHGSLEQLRIFLEETDVSGMRCSVESVLIATPYPVENLFINATDAYGSPPLHYAATEGKMGMVKMLIKNGAMVDTQDCFGNTALHYAAYGNHFKTALVLCKKGANVDLMNRAFKRPIDFASRINVQMIGMLRAYAQPKA